MSFLDSNAERLVKRAEEEGEAFSMLVLKYMDSYPRKIWIEILELDDIQNTLKTLNKRYSLRSVKLSLTISDPLARGILLRANKYTGNTECIIF